MINRDGVSYRLAIIGVGTALVVMLIGASTIAALGHGVPKELWAIGGALSGALVGILIPSPRAGSGREASPRAAGYTTHNAAVEAARKKVEEIEQEGGVGAADATAGAQAALEAVERQRRQLKTPLAAMATTDALREGGQAHEAAAAAVGLQHEALLHARAQLQAHPEDAKRKAAVKVHEAAHSAAAKAAPAAAQGESGWFGALRALTAEARIFIPLLLFIVTLALGALLGLGVIRAHPCPGEASSCSYYATTTKELSKVLVALASAAGGALLGVFAKSPGETAKPATADAKGHAG